MANNTFCFKQYDYKQYIILVQGALRQKSTFLFLIVANISELRTTTYVIK